MAEFKGAEILQALGLEETEGPLRNVERVVTNSWQVKAGDLYVALKGERFDGHKFLDNVAEAGAAGVVIRSDFEWSHPEVTVYSVPDPLLALGKLAAFHRRRFSIPIIGITGSVGKTSTKDLVAAVLGSEEEVLKTPGNYNNEIGLPLTLLELNSKHRYCVLEMGMRGLGEISYLASIARPNIGIVTNVEDVHIETLGSKEVISRAKAELVSALPTGHSLVILNYDNIYVRDMKEIAPGKVLTYGRAEQADIQGKVIMHSRDGLSIEYQWGQETGECYLPLYGRHQLGNVLAAIGVARFLGMSQEKIQEGFSKLVTTPMRMEPRTVRGIFVLNDAYNSSPRAVVAALQTFMEIGTGHRVALLGDMLELGELSPLAHKEILLYALQLGIDKIILTGDAMQKAQEEVFSKRILYAADQESLLRYLDENLYSGDSLLVKGSRGMKLEEVLKAWADSTGNYE